jgi:acetylornithine deacetylase
MDTKARDGTIAEAVAELRPAIVKALQELVRIPSQTGEEGVAQERVAGMMRGQGLQTDIWEPDAAELAAYAEYVTIGPGFAGRPNVVGAQRGSGGGCSLILNGHIDTVEPGEPAAWSVPALSGEVVDGRLFGRGACDMKGGVVANLFALAALNAAGIDLAGDVFVESTVSEEDGGAGALAAVLRGYTADGALISEPTNLAVIVAHGGSMMFRLHVPGLSAHACVRDEGVSAIEKFAYLHRGLLEFEARHNDEIDHPLYAAMTNKAPLNVGKVAGGSWPSSVPEWLVAEGRAGMVPGEDHAAFKRRFEAVVDTLADADPWLREHRPRVEWLGGSFLPSEVPADSPLVRALTEAAAAVSGSPPAITAATYGADMRHLILDGHTPCVMFGAGDVRDAHAPNESIALDDLFTAVAATAVFVANWCSAPPT